MVQIKTKAKLQAGRSKALELCMNSTQPINEASYRPTTIFVVTHYCNNVCNSDRSPARINLYTFQHDHYSLSTVIVFAFNLLWVKKMHYKYFTSSEEGKKTIIAITSCSKQQMNWSTRSPQDVCGVLGWLLAYVCTCKVVGRGQAAADLHHQIYREATSYSLVRWRCSRSATTLIWCERDNNAGLACGGKLKACVRANMHAAAAS